MNKEIKETYERFENVTPAPTTRTRSRKKMIKLILLLISYVLLALIVWFVTKSSSNPENMSPEQVQAELTATVKKVEKLMILPKGEMPQVAIIQDAAAVKQTQPLFADALDGDKILVYPNARKAIIYRESSNQIVNVIPNISTEAETEGTTPVDETTTASSTTTATSSQRKAADEE